MRTSPLAQRAFTLIEVAIVIVIVGLMSGLVMKSERAVQPTNCYLQTQEQLAKVTAALDSFVRRNNRYPLPAGRSIGTSDVNFGHEASVATSSAIDRLATAPSASNPILFGALPFQALGLSDAFAADCWGNKLSYVVTQSLTDSTASGFPSTSTFGGIEIRSGSGATLVSKRSLRGNQSWGTMATGQWRKTIPVLFLIMVGQHQKAQGSMARIAQLRIISYIPQPITAIPAHRISTTRSSISASAIPTVTVHIRRLGT